MLSLSINVDRCLYSNLCKVFLGFRNIHNISFIYTSKRHDFISAEIVSLFIARQNSYGFTNCTSYPWFCYLPNISFVYNFEWCDFVCDIVDFSIKAMKKCCQNIVGTCPLLGLVSLSHVQLNFAFRNKYKDDNLFVRNGLKIRTRSVGCTSFLPLPRAKYTQLYWTKTIKFSRQMPQYTVQLCNSVGQYSN